MPWCVGDLGSDELYANTHVELMIHLEEGMTSWLYQCSDWGSCIHLKWLQQAYLKTSVFLFGFFGHPYSVSQLNHKFVSMKWSLYFFVMKNFFLLRLLRNVYLLFWVSGSAGSPFVSSTESASESIVPVVCLLGVVLKFSLMATGI